MTEREWRYLLDGPMLPKMVYRSPQGFAMPQPIWCLRDGDDLVSVLWSQSPLVQAIGRGDSVQVWVDLEDGHATATYEGEAVVVSDALEVEIWSQWIWRHLKGNTQAALSPARCDALIRFTPLSCSETAAEQAYQLHHGFADDTGETLRAKLLYNVNDLLQDIYLGPMKSLDSVALIRSSDLGQELPTMDVFRVPTDKLVDNAALGDFLEGLFENSPEWVSVRAYLDNGVPCLLSFSAQNVARNEPHLGSKFSMSWRPDLPISFV